MSVTVSSMKKRKCVICGGTPCQWIEFGSDLLNDIEGKYDVSTVQEGFVMDYATATTISNDKVRHEAYKAFVFAQYGTLGKDNRVRIHECVLQKIREKCWCRLIDKK